jgi:hypothetical protein
MTCSKLRFLHQPSNLQLVSALCVQQAGDDLLTTLVRMILAEFPFAFESIDLNLKSYDGGGQFIDEAVVGVIHRPRLISSGFVSGHHALQNVR